MAGDDVTVSWVSDQLHELVGLSDRYTAEFLVGLAKKAHSSESYVRKLQETGAIAVNDSVRSFAVQLWSKVPHRQQTEKPARAREREILRQQERNRSYQLLPDSDEDEPKQKSSRKRKGSLGSGGKAKDSSRKRRNIRTEKASAWDSGEEEEEEVLAVKKSRGGESDSDEWEK